MKRFILWIVFFGMVLHFILVLLNLGNAYFNWGIFDIIPASLPNALILALFYVVALPIFCRRFGKYL